MIPERHQSWDETRAAFRWSIPQHYNIAEQCCDIWAKRDPDRPAILRWTGSELVATDYGTLYDRSCRLANVLSARGVQAGDRVAILLPQSVETVITHLALYRLGAIALPLALLFGPEALQFRLSFAGARALVTNGQGVDKMQAIAGDLPELQTILCTDGAKGDAVDFHQQISDASPRFANVVTHPDTPALMVFTSGTTGPPKGALHGHRVLAGHMPGVMMLYDFPPQGDDRFWTPADWAWAGGLLNILLPGLALGIPVVCDAAQKFNPERAFELMECAAIRNAFIPPTALKIMRSVERPQDRFDVALRSVFSGGESLGRETFEWGKDALGLTINEGYGQTECNLVLTSSALLGINRAGSMGKPTPGHDVAVIREDGTVCDVDEPGQIAVKRPDPVMFLEYWNRPDATAEKFIGDWMTTGDQGLVDGDGYFHFVGRDDDIITSAGFRIGPGEIEDCLLGHPKIRLAAAVGKPDPVRTEIVKCYIQLADGVAESEALKADISDYVRSRLSAHEFPREIEFVTDLPLTTTGKVIRRGFRERAQAEVG